MMWQFISRKQQRSPLRSGPARFTHDDRRARPAVRARPRCCGFWNLVSAHAWSENFRKRNGHTWWRAPIDFKCIENHGGTCSSEKQVELVPRLSRNRPRCCEKEVLSAPGVGFSNFTNHLVFSSTCTTKRLRRWSFWHEKWFCSLRAFFVYCWAFDRTAKSASTTVVEHGTSAGYLCVRKNGCKMIRFTSAVHLGLILLSQWGKHKGFVKHFFFNKKWKREASDFFQLPLAA